MPWILAVVFLAGYSIAFAWLSPLSLQDYPNHLARAQVIADLIFHHGARFGGAFHYHFVAIPYLLGDLLLAGASELFGIQHAAALWSVFVFLSLPCALLFYLRTTALANDGKTLLLILSAYLSTDWFFLVGFLEFRLGVAASLFALGLSEQVRRRPSVAVLTAYVTVLTLGYLTHLTTLVFVTAALGTSAALRLYRGATRLRTELALLIPCCVLVLWHFSSEEAYRQPGDLVENGYVWGTLLSKFARVASEFWRYRTPTDAMMACALALSVALYGGRVTRRDLKNPAALELLALAGTMIGLYFILPMGYTEAYYVDVRALPLAYLFVILALLTLSARTRHRRGRPVLAVCVAVLLVAANLAYLVRHLAVQSTWLRQYRAVIAAIPPGAQVLPIYTRGPEGNVVPFLHAHSFIMIDRGGVVPYLQTGDTGNPQKYIRYVNRAYAPLQTWYGDSPAPLVDWQAVACEYDFILVTKPFEPRRLKAPVRLIVENSSAALLALAPQSSCR